MKSLSTKENYFIGMSIANSANYDSSICVLDRLLNVIFIDKFYFADDIEYFLENSPYIKNSIVCATVVYDNKILEGKWRIHSKNYKMLSDYFKVNKGDWTNRISLRCQAGLKKLTDKGIKVIRADINQLRQSYKLEPYFLSRTSIDCKNLQALLKLKFNILNLPDNMLSASALEAIICAVFAMEYANGVETTTTFDIADIPVMARKPD